MTLTSYTHSALAAFRRCPREFQLGYVEQLDPVGMEREALRVGDTWHRAFHAMQTTGNDADAYETIERRAPGPLWRVKLARLFAAHGWYWAKDPLPVVESERTFHSVQIAGASFSGQIDGVIQLADGRRGIIERKTTGFDIGPDGAFWDGLGLGIQTAIYEQALDFVPDFVLYDVVRKPTIYPKKVPKADITRMRAEIGDIGCATYFGEPIEESEFELAMQTGKETPVMYGARLTNDIGNDPCKYFARREMPRTQQDRDATNADLRSQIAMIEAASRFVDGSIGFHRNADACNDKWRCRFFGLCSMNVHPTGGVVPDGFERREHLHPELSPLNG